MLTLTSPADLAKLLRTTVPQLFSTLRRADELYNHLLLLDPKKPDKTRPLVSPKGVLRFWQRRFYTHALLPHLTRSPHSHGGVPGRSILTNVEQHAANTFVFTADVRSFYPSISSQRVTRLFKSLGCSDEVAGLCTRLCTYQHRLEQGLITSPILADQLMRPVDSRIAGACKGLGLTYTRFVDDLAISGPFDLQTSAIPDLVGRILSEHGFRQHKDTSGSFDKGASITKLRFKNGHPDVQQDYIAELERQLGDLAQLGAGGNFVGPYYTEDQIRGRVQFVCWINPGRRQQLYRRLGSIDWNAVRAEAQRRGLEAAVKRLLRK